MKPTLCIYLHLQFHCPFNLSLTPTTNQQEHHCNFSHQLNLYGMIGMHGKNIFGQLKLNLKGSD
jgi:hypothetical protein